jgi:hypothetical protein
MVERFCYINVQNVKIAVRRRPVPLLHITLHFLFLVHLVTLSRNGPGKKSHLWLSIPSEFNSVVLSQSEEEVKQGGRLLSIA